MFPVQEIYSIDESFGTHIPDSWQCEPYGREIKNRVEQHTGIPVAVGFGATRTLAKLANRWAKKTQWFEGVVSWSELSPHQAQMLLKKTPADDVWGIGYRIARRLEEVGVKTAWDFMQVQPRDIRGVFNVTLAKTHRELWGESCLRVEDIENQTPKQIVSSRSFGARVESKLLLQQSLSQYVSRAAEKLRKHQLKAQQLSVWIRTSPFDQSQPYYAPAQTYSLAIPSDDSREFAAITRQLLDRIYKPGKEYHKAGVMLGELVDAHRVQPDLFASRPESTLMSTLDRINQRYGKRKMVLGSNLRDQQWKMRQNMRSPSYTTQWKELASVR
jgi:DNA polymerase V